MTISELIFAAACVLLGVWFTEIIPYARWAKAVTGVLWIITGILALTPIIIR